jgi:hypothetical protein
MNTSGLVIPASELEGDSLMHSVIVAIPKGTMITKDHGKAYRARKDFVAATSAIREGEILWESVDGNTFYATAVHGILVYDPEHRHSLRTSTSISGAQPDPWWRHLSQGARHMHMRMEERRQRAHS